MRALELVVFLVYLFLGAWISRAFVPPEKRSALTTIVVCLVWPFLLVGYAIARVAGNSPEQFWKHW